MNPAFFIALAARIDSATSCDHIASLTSEINAIVGGMQDEIQARIAEILPLLAAPTSPDAAVTWITNYISLLNKPYQAYLAQLTFIAAQMVAIEQKIAQKLTQLGCD